jgi:hypothetical protein
MPELASEILPPEQTANDEEADDKRQYQRQCDNELCRRCPLLAIPALGERVEDIKRASLCCR